MGRLDDIGEKGVQILLLFASLRGERRRTNREKETYFRQQIIASRGGFSASTVRWHSVASRPGVCRDRFDRVGGRVGCEAENESAERRSEDEFGHRVRDGI